jgi:hypothetical protein
MAMMQPVDREPLQIRLQVARDRGGEFYESTEIIDLRPTARDALNIDYSANFVADDASLRRILANLVLESDYTWYLDDDGHLTPLRSSATPAWPVGRFIVTSREGRLIRWDFPHFGRLRLLRQNASVRLEAPLLDRSSCGLSVWPNAKWAHRRDEISLEVSRTSLNRLEDCSWIEPYPDGARAVICLTDHADFDSPEKAKLIADQLVRRDVRITKSVFPAADPPSPWPWEETGLDNADYRGSIERLVENGSEIALHGFTPKRDAPPLSECKRRLDLVRQYGLTTWIDHGIGDYLFSRGGRLPGGVTLETLLEENGIQNYWSYFDVWDNPFGKDLSVLAARSGLNVVSDFVSRNHCWPKTSRREALWFALHEFRNIVGDSNDLPIRQSPWRLAAWRKGFQWYLIARQVRRAPLGIYGRDGAVFQQSLQSPWVFDTVLLNHLSLQLAPAMINKLIRTGGLLVAHSYMTCEFDYARRNVFQRQNGRVAVDPAFETALDYISDRQRSAELMTMSFAQLRQCLDLFVRTRLRRTKTGWKTELSDGVTRHERRPTGGRSARELAGARFTLPRRALMERQPLAVD